MPDVSPQGSYLSFLCLAFLTCKMEVLTVAASLGSCEEALSGMQGIQQGLWKSTLSLPALSRAYTAKSLVSVTGPTSGPTLHQALPWWLEMNPSTKQIRILLDPTL